jgi:hypothetical protein
VLIALRNLVDRARQVPARAAELHQLRRRFAEVVQADEQLRTMAHRMRELRARASAALGAVDACRSCTRGCAPPQGIYDGGHCCSGDTADVFNPDEVAALAYSGTRVRNLRAPREQHAGCAFRGPAGCTLEAVDRPNVCTLYLCRDLRHELFDRGSLDELECVVDELGEVYERFVARHAEVCAGAELAEIHPAL